MKNDLTEALRLYTPYNEQEANDQAVMLQLLLTQPDLFERKNQTAHFSASSWLLNKSHDKALMVYHNLYRSWSWTGGHADGDRDLLAVALREAKEETGLAELRPLSEEIFSLEILPVNGHEKKGVYVPSHLHLNITYLVEADEKDTLCSKPDENSGVQWFALEDAENASSEPWMTQRIYRKLNEKIRRRR
ncbi:MAG: NUDIX hydrolase [Eubacteriales bacterium]|nr:NUDIX hydrolase [Eubacteriales bacterium]